MIDKKTHGRRGLSERRRQYVLDLYSKGNTYREIAILVGVSVSTVHKIVTEVA
jgi:DNA-directed RNA polymerase specialized sigma24 family protein